MTLQTPDAASPQDGMLEDLPEGIAQTMRERAEWLKTLPRRSTGEEFLVADLQRWTPGQAVRVAFLGGTSALHKEIVDAVTQITQACNLTFDFGLDQATGRYRSWSAEDTEYAAEIRLSFDFPGYWSLVGTDSIDAAVGKPDEGAGGRPNQRSLNLGGYHVRKPTDWQGTTRHEFMHAIAFHHEHQNFRGPCAGEFRWDDDAGYVRTTDARGTFVTDSEGRRPGIYTYLSGPPNNWSKAKVDHNLRQHDNPEETAGEFDPASVMLYRFPALFYRTADSPCAPTTDGQNLSEGDKAGLTLLYPASPHAAALEVERRVEFLNAIESQPQVLENIGLESTQPPPSVLFRSAAAAALRATLPR